MPARTEAAAHPRSPKGPASVLVSAAFLRPAKGPITSGKSCPAGHTGSHREPLFPPVPASRRPGQRSHSKGCPAPGHPSEPLHPEPPSASRCQPPALPESHAPRRLQSESNCPERRIPLRIPKPGSERQGPFCGSPGSNPHRPGTWSASRSLRPGAPA